MTLLAPASTPTLTVRPTGRDTYTADVNGRFAGTIDVQGPNHYVRDGFGQYLGDYATLTAARHRLTEHHRSR